MVIGSASSMLAAVVVIISSSDGKTVLKLEMVGWKGKKSVRAYVPKMDRIHYLRLVGGDTSKFETNKFQNRRDAAAAKADAVAEEPDAADHGGEDTIEKDELEQ